MVKNKKKNMKSALFFLIILVLILVIFNYSKFKDKEAIPSVDTKGIHNYPGTVIITFFSDKIEGETMNDKENEIQQLIEDTNTNIINIDYSEHNNLIDVVVNTREGMEEEYIKKIKLEYPDKIFKIERATVKVL
jgi:hypothetical protein